MAQLAIRRIEPKVLDRKKQRQFMDWFSLQNGMEHLDDWYSKDVEELCDWGGEPLLRLFNHSLMEALQALFPEKEWKAWKFKNAKNQLDLWNKDHRKHF